MPGTLYLIPSTLGPGAIDTIPQRTLLITRRLRHFVVETGKVARAFLKEVELDHRLQECTYYELNKRTRPDELPTFLAPALSGEDVGVLSDAGAPGVADPGAKLVRLAHQLGVPVVPLVGPSAILLSIMAAGLQGQSFTFHGYLSPKRPQLAKDLRRLEADSRKQQQTQLWIEAPYRNQATVEVAVATLAPTTLFSVAADLTTPTEWIKTAPASEWGADAGAVLQKRPAMFLLLA
ncbi:Ribosomal RNA small subunit methyltransferase I [Neolewinella maritima]|uniref:Ribosomal RNA small subunit methyltransferase I n=1 Tax=Neolewinella maritima TaxID=1383882 RepID=A0ABM9B283_9BACT|nr:SAM-dependent methyltransferase [Neolewinella maritima]CAH1001307.1 Ribosomal RNA small subunit methyltransferase I [Neolewinella maritima]